MIQEQNHHVRNAKTGLVRFRRLELITKMDLSNNQLVGYLDPEFAYLSMQSVIVSGNEVWFTQFIRKCANSYHSSWITVVVSKSKL
jgi:hypothetical protein